MSAANRTVAVAVAAMVIAAAGTFSFTAVSASARSAVIPDASGTQQISSGPGVYAQTTDEYAGSWSWTQLSASYDYYWYIFQSNGSLAASGHNPYGGGGSKTLPANIYYFKEYNNEPAGSGHINILSVDYCC